MTTVDTAAAWRLNRPFALAAILILTATGLAGCETGSNLLSSTSPATTLADPATPSAASRKMATLAIAPVIGAPESIAKQLHSQLASSAEKQNIGVAKAGGERPNYTLRGYIVSTREKAGTKVSYIWDITDLSDKRVHRITGEEMIAGAESKDPWAQISPQITQSIADKTATSLATWLPTQSGTAAIPVAAATAPSQVALGGPDSSSTVPKPIASGQGAAVAAAHQTTGSIGSGSLTASVPSVVGAPGDGSTALTGAIQRELQRGGVQLANSTAVPSSYKVEGRVSLGESRDGKQPITIDWDVKDPQGRKLGTVSQKNEIQPGSLDKGWGKTADAAAAAAAQGILKLLPAQKATN